MKLLSWLLILCFTTQVFAGTVREDLTSALNNYEYSMVVDWDQKDAAKAEAFNKEFSDTLEKLFQKGLTQTELMSVVEARVTDKEKLEMLKMKVNLLKDSASDAHSVANLLQSELSDMGHRGASWNGEVQMYALAIVPLVLLGALIIYQHMWNQSHRCTQAARVEVCNSVCDDYSYRDSCSTWDSSTCSTGEYCARSHEECGLEQRCQEWEKI